MHAPRQITRYIKKLLNLEFDDGLLSPAAHTSQILIMESNGAR